ncbi:hypothetical protein LCM4579_22965 [Ensifer sp. LCM 4579]|nr:hypothetical protein LCM4579_22965 [Ensifer sp. LCM 4579]
MAHRNLPRPAAVYGIDIGKNILPEPFCWERRAPIIMAWLQPQFTRERPDTFTQLESSLPRHDPLHGLSITVGLISSG